MSGDIKDDPIFEVIEAHRRADASFMEAMRAQHRRHDDKGSDMVDWRTHRAKPPFDYCRRRPRRCPAQLRYCATCWNAKPLAIKFLKSIG